ncbi:hypothetical protein BC829DRAFT_449297 [Chytridium lagenaria]|nr:hypothetical protein BC829DRAFT_449297 [Chytridium lagenaria]
MDHAVADAAVAYLQSAAQEVHHTEVDWQVQMGYRKIKELDEILRQKQQLTELSSQLANGKLGPNARYYDAMTEAEEMRVRSILEDDEEKEPEEPETPAEVFIPRVLSSASPEDQLRLEEIDRKLKQLSDTPFNSLVTTPLTRSQSSASKDVDIILSSRIEFENPHLTRDPEVIQKLHDIDAKLAQLKEDDHKLASEAEIRR